MRPFDPRLLRRATATRTWIVVAAAALVLHAALTVVMALAVADVVAAAIHDVPLRWFSDHLSALCAAGGALALRAVVAFIQQRFAEHSVSAIVGQLRLHGLTYLTRQPTHARATHGSIAVGVTSGLDALDGYLAKFLPQLIATCIITPGLIAVTWYLDRPSAILEIITVPLIPLFMALIGWSTQRFAQRRLDVMEQLAQQLLDLVAGLATLRHSRRAVDQAGAVEATATNYRDRTMTVLRNAFQSGFALEVLTTLSVASVAVGCGLRLLNGSLSLAPALAALLLAPEVYLPLRLVGQHFHTSADGLAAAKTVLDVDALPQLPAAHGGAPLPAAPISAISWTNFSVMHEGRGVVAPQSFTGTARAGEVTVLVGENGSGKSTALAGALGLREVEPGQISIECAGHAVDVTGIARSVIHQRVAWLPQHPAITPGSVLDNLWLSEQHITNDSFLDDLAASAGLTKTLEELPQGWATPLGASGFGVSAGQRQRIALARALARVRLGAEVFVVDEPTAHLDAATEQIIVTAMRECAQAGVVVVAVTHRPELIAWADASYEVLGGEHVPNAAL